MAQFVIPNTPDAAHIDQSEPDAGDFAALGARQTGVISGGTVSALGTPAMAVALEATTIAINGVPYSFGPTNKTIQAAGGSARFDLVGWDSTGAQVITGQSGPNPTFPAYDPLTFCLGAAVYVTAGASSITAQYVTSKGVTMEPSFRRTFATLDDVLQQAIVALDTYTVTAGGKHTWADSVLRKVSTKAMEWVTSLTMKPSDDTQPVVILKARASDPGNHKLLVIQPSGATTELAWVDGLGRIHASNFRWGAGSPEGVVTANAGAIYTDTNSAVSTLWVKSTGSGNTGWGSYRAYDPTLGSIPAGSVVPWIGATGTPVPAGYVRGQGQLLDTSTYANLFAIAGYRYGGSGSQFGIPDLRGMMLIGDEGVTQLPVGFVGGNMNGYVQITELNLPPHSHNVHDPGHAHPQAGPYWYYRPSAFHNNRHPFPSTSLSLEHLYVDWNTERAGYTGISIGHTGGNHALHIMPPVHTIQWMIKT